MLLIGIYSANASIRKKTSTKTIRLEIVRTENKM